MKEYPAYAVGIVKNGEVLLSETQKKTMSHYLVKNEGRMVRITFSKEEKQRSNNQNRYYWGVVLAAIAAETGHTTEEIHEFLKATFLPRKFLSIGKTQQELTKSTTTLSTLDFEDYLDRVRMFAATELQLTIPMPEQSLLPTISEHE